MDSGSGGSYGIPQKRLHGHGHFVSDVVLSSDGYVGPILRHPRSKPTRERLWGGKVCQELQSEESSSGNQLRLGDGADHDRIVATEGEEETRTPVLLQDILLPPSPHQLPFGHR